MGTDASIRQNLKALAKAFTQGTRQDIASFNIIPGSTLFLEGAWSDIDVDYLTPKLRQLMTTFNYSTIHIICVNKASIALFWDYLEG